MPTRQALRSLRFNIMSVEGLLLPVGRNQANYRIYNESSVDRITFIKNAQKLGFSLLEIKQLLQLKNSDNACPNSLDYLIMKNHEIKNDITRLTNQKDNIELLIKKCTEADPDQCTSQFLSYLESMPVTPSSELIFCTHSYLYDTGYWELDGNFQMNGFPSVGMTGHVSVEHKENVWHVKRILNFKRFRKYD